MNKKALLGILFVFVAFLGCARSLSHEEYIKCRQAIFREFHKPKDKSYEYHEYYDNPLRYYFKELLYSKDAGGYVRYYRELRNELYDAAVKGCFSQGYSFRRFNVSHKLYGRYNLLFSEELMVLDPRPFEIKRARKAYTKCLRDELFLSGYLVLAVDKNGSLKIDGYPVTMIELPSYLEGYTPVEFKDSSDGKSVLPEIVIDVDSGILCSELWPVLALLREQGKKHVLIDHELGSVFGEPSSAFEWSRQIYLELPDTGFTCIPRRNILALTLGPRPEENSRQIEYIVQQLEPPEDLDIYSGSCLRNWCIVWRVGDVNYGELKKAIVYINSSLAGEHRMFLLSTEEYNALKRSGRTINPRTVPAYYRRMARDRKPIY